jgi:ribonuclease HI
MKQTILAIPSPTSTRGVREFLGSAGFCRLWIPGFAEIARPLYEATKEAPDWSWGEREQQAFDQLKDALLQAPALALPDPTRPFTLFVDEKKGVAKGVLTQQLGPWKRPVAYFSKKLDAVAAGWPPCLRIIAAIAVLVREADKLTFGQALWVTAPHPVEGILKQPPGKWMTNARLTHYQGLLLDSPRITFTDPVILNPATLLPNPELQTPVHNCKEFLSEVTQVRADLKDTPLSGCKLNWYTDGSSFFQDGARRAGAAVVDQEGNTVWSSALPPGTSAQKAELIALAEALERAKGKQVNIYTDSRYAFGTIHVHGAIYRERGFRTAEGKHLKNLAKVQRLLMAVEKPKAVAVMYVPGHQSAKTPEAVGNNRADQEAKRVAMVSPPMETGQPSTVAAIDVPVPELPPLPPRPEYSTEDFTWMRAHSPFREGEDGWKSDLEGKLILPEKLGRFLLANLHKSTHLGRRKLLDLLTSAQLRFPNQTIAVRQIVEDCASCTIMKPGRREGHHTGTRERGRAPGRSWEVDFTEVKPGKFGYKYLLVFIDTFSGWVEAFPTKKETSQVVAKALLEEIIPRYGVPEAIGSDNGPAFVSKVLQGLAQTMGANWKLHCEYNPQSSGQVERMNRTLKETLAKLALETGGDWVTLLPLAIFRVRNSPYVHGLTPFEILYGAPPPIIQRTLSPELGDLAPNYLTMLQALAKVQQRIWPLIQAYHAVKRDPAPEHGIVPGDMVWVKRHQSKTLEPRWKGPYVVLFTTPTALKVDGIAAWVHHSHVRRAHPPEKKQENWSARKHPTNPLKLRLIRDAPKNENTPDAPQPS